MVLQTQTRASEHPVTGAKDGASPSRSGGAGLEGRKPERDPCPGGKREAAGTWRACCGQGRGPPGKQGASRLARPQHRRGSGSLSLCALSALRHQGLERVPGVLDSQSRTERVVPTPLWLPLPSGCLARLGEPPGPLRPLPPDHEAALAGSVVTQRCSHSAHILIAVGLRCLSASHCARTEPLHGRTGQGATQILSSPSLSFRGGRKQTEKEKKDLPFQKETQKSE